MFDLIGKRRWYYIFSALITIPGLIFIILTPATRGATGLKFSIDYTGGTVWEIHFRDGTPAPQEVKEVLAQQGHPESTVATTDGGYVLIRTEPIDLREREEFDPCASPSPGASPNASGSPGASGSPAASAPPGASGSPAADPAASPSPTGSPAVSPSPGATGSPSPAASPCPSPGPSASPGASATSSPGASGSAGPSGTAAAGSPAASASPGAAAGTTASPGASLPIAGARDNDLVPTEGPLAELAAALQARFGPIDAERQRTTVGPIISEELTQQALLLIALGSVGILGWMTFRFGDFRMGAVAIAALVHDVIVVVGTFAILGTFLGIQIDALFVTAMLTVIGFSVHDTIVVFDRIRENRVRHAGEPFSAIVNHSLLQTLGRSLNTSLTVVITLTALLLFGGEAIRTFVLALLIGIVSGTYSSIFNASALLVTWHEWTEKRRQQELLSARASR